MSSNLCVIIKNRQTWANEPIDIVCSKSIETLSQFFSCKSESAIVAKDNDSLDDHSLHILYGDMILHVKNGYWILDTLRRYECLLYKKNNKYTVRELIFDITQGLGANEVYYFEDNFDYVFSDFSLAQIKESLESEGTEFLSFSKLSDTEELSGKAIYDRFEDYSQRFEYLKNNNQLCLMPYAYGYNIEKIDNNLFFVKETQAIPIDDFHYGLNGSEITIIKNGKSAVIDENGQFLSEFVDGLFHWEPGNHSVKKFICNDTAHIRIPIQKDL